MLRYAAACLAAALIAGPASAQGTLRIAMTAGDIPTTTGMPNNGFEGMRFMGYPVFESLILWDHSNPKAPSGLRPGLATAWKQDAKDPSTWVFTLRKDVKFHDGSPWNADAFVWNMERYMNDKAKQYEPQAAGLTRARNPYVKSYAKIDDYTVSVTTIRPLSYFPMLMVWPLMTSPAGWEKTGNWIEYAKAPSGTGPFKLARWTPRQSAELEKNAAYWDRTRIPKLDKIALLPIPEATTRTAALRSGQVDWIEAPAPDAIPSLKSAGYVLSTNSYPHYWPWSLNTTKAPFSDLRVRQAINYCVDREAVVKLVGGMAEPSIGYFSAKHPNFGKPAQEYKYDPAKAKQLLAAAGYEGKRIPVKVMISTSGSGQMQPLPMNELIQQQVAACGFDVSFEVVEWGLVLNAWRNGAPGKESRGVDGLNISSPSIDIATMARYLLSGNGGPNGANWGHFKSEAYDRIIQRIETDPAALASGTTQAHQLIVDEAPYLFVVHDLNPVMYSSKVKGFTQAQSWFQDYTKVWMEQ
ncbi:MAG: ABC transporter substrate-binding protein [Betaproteobacteria bacterium]|nr:ABC transporter substrate-binding protein [Betaproteobacteria bacterium]MBV9362486.1 ABC transporter substrate-binding protein [Betaproteobacteria bacterium]